MTPKAFNKAMGAAIRELRLKRGLSQADLGHAVGVTYQQIQKNERGINALYAYSIPVLANMLGVTIADLYQRAGMKIGHIPSAPENDDACLAARYVAKIASPTTRAILVDQARQFAYRGGRA